MGDTTLFTSHLPLAFAVVALALSSIIWILRFPWVSIALLSFSLVVGQLIRFPLPGQGGGLLVSDAAICLCLICAGIILLQKKKIYSSLMLGFTGITLFLAWALITFFLANPDPSKSMLLVTVAYWARLAASLLLLPALLILVEEKKNYLALYWGIIVAAVTLLVLGLLQYFIFPNLALLASLGWDPHDHRLVSTWLDPNYIGLFIALIAPVLLSVKKAPLLSVYALVGLPLALLMTQSRTAWVAALVGGTIATPLILMGKKTEISSRAKTAYISIAISIIGGAITMGLLFIPDRLVGLVTSDATISLRQEALGVVWENIITPHALLGVGYNAYQFYAASAGLVGNFTTHSRAGADNSFFTIWATTGIVGLIVGGLMVTWVVQVSFAYWCKERSYTSAVPLVAVITFAVGGLFINALLYSHLLITIACIIALSWHVQGEEKQIYGH